MSDEPDWRRPPSIVAPCHSDRSIMVRYKISDDLTGARRSNWRKSPLYLVWAHLVGSLPPLANVSAVERDEIKPTICTLNDAIACFQGVNRPHLMEDEGESVLVYVLKISGTLEYAVRMTCPIRAVPFPDAAVLTVQVRLRETLQDSCSGLDGLSPEWNR